MKTLFLGLFLLISSLLGLRVVLLLREHDPKAQPDETYQDRAFDMVEKLLTKATQYPIFDSLETKIDEMEGFCNIVAKPKPGGEKALAQTTITPGASFPFSLPYTLDNTGLLCRFPVSEKSILLVPASPTNFIIRRRRGLPGTLTYGSGNFSLYSDAVNIILALPDMKVTLQSKAPVSLMFTELEGRLQIQLNKSALDVTVKPRLGSSWPSALQAPYVVRFILAEGSSITSEGKPVSNLESVDLLPSGPLVLSNSGNAPAHAAPVPAH